MFADAGVTVVDFIDLDPLNSSSKVMCNICMDDIEERDVTRMDCGHCFCNDCKFHSFNWLCTRLCIGIGICCIKEISKIVVSPACYSDLTRYY